ncbi:MAG: hypothetical protein IT460_09725 [Planctomycetes bacterium]|nr:hypothetical protein [Planctomycetota bacterium]
MLRPRLPLLALALSSLLAACGTPEPRYRQRNAAEWADRLFASDSKDVSEAIDALVAIAGKDHARVLDALAARLRKPPPKPLAAPFTVVVDAEAAGKLGLPAVPAVDRVAAVLPKVRARLAELGFAPVSIRATSGDDIDIVCHAPKSRAQVQRMQALLCRRGAIDLRVVVPDPAAPPAPLAVRKTVYDDATPYAERLAAERALLADARRRGAAYVPGSKRWAAAAPAGEDVAGAVLVEEPTTDADAMDERIAASVTGAFDGDKVGLVVQVRTERVPDVRRFFGRNTGLELAVIVDGVLVHRAPMPGSDGTLVTLPFGHAAPGGSAKELCEDYTILFWHGRMPFPLKPLPIAEQYDADPPPENPFSRTLALLGPDATPTLDKIEKGDWPAWAKASAAWAREHLSPTAPEPGR